MRSDREQIKESKFQRDESLKRSILWNAVVPGDPYDIRKSMIAKLPGKNHFMGDKLELICLMQAVQIERLSQFLEQYRVKYKEIERLELDRHSYEVQIKELTEKIQQESGSASENVKLKEFINRLNQELDLSQRNSQGSQEVVAKYQQALYQIQSLSEEQKKIIEQRNSLLKERSHLTITAQNKSKELIEYRSKVDATSSQQLKLHNKTLQEYEDRFTVMGKEIERLNQTLQQKIIQHQEISHKYHQTEQQFQHAKLQLDYLQQENTKFKAENDSLHIEIQKQIKFSQNNHSEIQQINDINESYQAKIETCTHEIERLNQVLKQTLTEKKEQTNRASQLENKLKSNEENHRKNVESIYLEVQRLNALLRNKFDQNNALTAKINKVINENQHFITQINDLEAHANKFKEISVQIQHLDQKLKEKEKEINILTESNFYQKQKNNNYENQASKQVEEIKRLNEVLEKKKKQFNLATQERQAVKEQLFEVTNIMTRYEAKMPDFSQEITRLNEILKIKINEIQSLKVERENISLEKKKIIESNEQLARDLAQFQILKQEKQSLETQVQSYENKLALISQEIQRLNYSLQERGSLIKAKDKEIQQWRIKDKQIEQLRVNIEETDQLRKEHQMTMIQNRNQLNLIRTLEHEAAELPSLDQLKDLEQRNEELSSLNEKYENRIIEISRQIERLNQQLKVILIESKEKSMKIGDSEAHNKQMHEEILQLRSAQQRYRQNEQYMNEDVERLNNLLRLKIEESTRWEKSHAESLTRIQSFLENQQQKESECHHLKHNIHLFNQENLQIKAKLGEYEQSIAKLSAEFERLQHILENLKGQNLKLRQQMRSSEDAIAKNRHLSEEIDRLTQVVERQNQDAKEMRLHLADSFSLDKRIQEHLALFVVLFAEIQTLRQRLELNDKQVEEVRRSSLISYHL